MRRTSLSRGLARFVLLALALSLFAAPAASKDKKNDASQQMQFGVDMAKRGLWSEALFRFKQVEKIQPNNARNLNNMAVAYEALGLFEQALDYYQQAIKGNPSDKDLKRNYSRFVEFYRSYKATDEDEDDS